MGCAISTVMCDPATNEPILIVNNGFGGTPSYYLQRDPSTVWSGDPNTLEQCSDGGSAVVDLHALIEALPEPPFSGLKLGQLVAVAFDGNCYRVNHPGWGFADAGGDPWDSNNGSWINPVALPEFCTLYISNGVTGSETWIIQQDVNGVNQWHQMA